MKYNFNKIVPGEHFIYIGSSVDTQPFNKRVYGIQWNSSDTQSYKTERIEEILNEDELMILGLYQTLKLIYEYTREIKDPYWSQRFIISLDSNKALKLYNNGNFENSYMSKIAGYADIYEAMLLRESHEVDIGVGLITAELEEIIRRARDEYRLTNDFQGEQLILSSVSNEYFDRLIFENSEFNLVEYISPTEKGVPGVPKRLIFADDESSVNPITDINVAGSKLKSQYLVSRARRMVMTVRDSDIAFFITECSGDENFSFPSIYFYIATQHFNIPIYILDTNELIWYTRSKSEKRDIVQVKKMPKMSTYKNIALWTSINNVEKTWEILKKVLKN